MSGMTTMLTQPGYQISCFTSVLAFAFTLYNTLRPDPCAKIIDSPQVEPEYDFVIIGAGSGGSVVANRLSEVRNWKILLLEAGGQETDFSDVPFLVDTLQDTDLDWKYKTEPPTSGKGYCLAMTNNSCKWIRGKVVGGSSVLNYMQYIRGNRLDFDGWEALGNKGWGYNNVLKYFLKSENNTNHALLKTPYHSCNGHLSVENARYNSPMAGVFTRGGKAIGYEHLDVNGKNQTGFSIQQGTTRDGRRCSTSKAFIRPAQRRPNLSISMYSFVTRIGFKDKDSKLKATTVYYVKGGKEYSVKARKEIILSAGAINSPQILMLSGIGPKRHLSDLRIKPLKDLPVGYNLQDHVTTGALLFQVDKPVTFNLSAAQTPDAVLDYLEYGRGPLTSLGLIDGIGFVNTRYAEPSGLYPDIQFLLQSTSIYNIGNGSFGNAMYNLRPDLFNGTGYEKLTEKYLFQFGAFLLRPKSNGRVLLRSKDPFIQPIIIPNYFSKKEDLAVLIDGIRIAFELFKTPPFKALNTAPVRIPFPGCEKYKLFSDAYWECCLRHFTVTFYHPTCTCPMGVGPNAVVDPSLKVHGVDGLRVIDASVMPNITSGNTNTPTIMIAERGCDLIKEYWNAHMEPDFEYTDKRGCRRRTGC